MKVQKWKMVASTDDDTKFASGPFEEATVAEQAGIKLLGTYLGGHAVGEFRVEEVWVEDRIDNPPGEVESGDTEIPFHLKTLLRKKYRPHFQAIWEILLVESDDKKIVEGMKLAGILAPSTYWKDGCRFYRRLKKEMSNWQDHE